ncbi:HyaD/HybD family hydrogenase maturation endopeptidase [Desulfolithobacter sp.]
MQLQKIGILGIGNLLLRDEGFGVHFVEKFNHLYRVPKNVQVLDGGTAGIMLAPFIENVDVLYVVDTVSLDDEPGSIHRFTDQDVRSGNIQTRMSPHQVGLLEILSLCELRGKSPERVEMITVVPEDLSTGIGLSPRLEPRIGEVLVIIIKCLATHGVVLEEKEPGARA